METISHLISSVGISFASGEERGISSLKKYLYSGLESYIVSRVSSINDTAAVDTNMGAVGILSS